MEGEDIPPPTDLDCIAFRIANLLGAGRGSLDWRSLPFLAAWFGVDDVEGLMYRLITIANYRPPRDNHGNSNPVD